MTFASITELMSKIDILLESKRARMVPQIEPDAPVLPLLTGRFRPLSRGVLPIPEVGIGILKHQVVRHRPRRVSPTRPH